MFSAGTLTFQEFMAHEKLPLATIQNAVLEFLRGRRDAVVFGAQAVNAYVKEPRMTQDIDLLSTRAEDLAGELQEHLRQQFRIAVRMREISNRKGYRLYQVQKSRNRHLVDIRPVATLPPTKRISKVLVVTPPELIANKVISYHQRRGKPKSGTDWRDLAMLLLKYPQLKHKYGPVLERLQAAEVDPAILSVWNELVTQEITPADDDEF
ncbi:MAG: nucleotidyl transferase AbiEii/AbiGii toxin family protein [bacterium]